MINDENTLKQIKELGKQFSEQIATIFMKYTEDNKGAVAGVVSCAFEDALLANLFASLSSIPSNSVLKMQAFDYINLLSSRIDELILTRESKITENPIMKQLYSIIKEETAKYKAEELMTTLPKKADPKDLN